MTYHLTALAAVPAVYTTRRLSKFVRRFNVVSDVVNGREKKSGERP